MTQFFHINLPELNFHQENAEILSPNNVCLCCLDQNVSFVKLAECKHCSFLEFILKNKVCYKDALVCYQCHSILKKIELFKNRAEESLQLLNKQVKIIKISSKLDLSYSVTKFATLPIEESNDLPIYDVKDESTNQETVFVTTEVKVEHDSSDFETDIPLAQIKEEIKSVGRKRKKKVKEKIKGDTKKEKKEKQSLNKYEGKIVTVNLTKEEMLEERAKCAQKEAYLKLPFKCESCITGFDYDLTYKDHMEKRHAMKKGSFVCEVCKSVLSTELSYKEHTKRHFRRYECVECGRRNNNLYSVLKHYNEQHGAIETTMYACQDCDFVTKFHRSFRYHREKHKEKEQCNECGKTFVTKTAWRVHMFTVHKHSTREYRCTACNKCYRAKSGLLAHIASTHAQRTAYCVLCHVHFRTEHNLRHHLKTHSKHRTEENDRFICDECGSKFMTKRALQEHIDWIHLKKTKHQCDKCSKAFKNNSSLKKHYKYVHEKMRPPRNKICDYCGRAFTSLSILRSHIRTHTGERPLRCTRCPASFAHSAALYTHNKLLHRRRTRDSEEAT